MCISCKKIWTALHVLGSVIYVSTGAVQIVIGIFFVISIPIFSLSSNIWVGSWNVLVGICGGMFACFGKQTAGRQELLLYLIVSIIIVNTVNTAIYEWHFFMYNSIGDEFEDIIRTLIRGRNSTTELLSEEKGDYIHNTNNIYYVVLTARICAAVVIITAFVDSQFTYCSIQSQNRSQTAKAKKNKGSHEQVSDIEYIIPRPKKNTAPKSNKNIYNAYAQSWVFDADATVSTNNSENSPYLKLDDVIDNNDSTTNLSVPTPTKHSLKYDIITRNGSITSSALAFDDTDNILKAPVVHIEEASDDSNSNNTNAGVGGVRKLSAMKSFSRTPSPNVLSASSSQVSLVVVTPQIYECLERLTEPSVYRSRLSTAISERDIQQRCISPVSCKSPGHPEARSPIGGEKVQYASLMQELQQQFMNKKDKLKHQTSSPPSADHSVTVSDKSSRQEESSSRTTTDPKSNSDTEFSKELEAALQLIQDLESPNTTIETPSEEPPPYRVQKTSNIWRGSLNVDNNCTITDDNTSESDEKTLSAIGSLAELTSPMTECFPSDVLHTFKPQLHGKSTSVISILNTDSQSTSGYSSPTFHNFNGSNNIINNNIHQLGSNSSSINGSTNDLGNKLACSILNTKTATIISLRRPINNILNNNIDNTKRKSITLVNINSNDEMIVNECCIRSKIPPKPPIRQDSIPNNNKTTINADKPNISYIEKAQTIDRISRINNNNNHDLMKNSCGSLNRLGNLGINHNNNSSTSLWNVKSLLRKKKIHVPPLPPELEGAIIKSESLAYLSDDELLARHERNRQIQRHIEQRVHQQLTGQIPSESHC